MGRYSRFGDQQVSNGLLFIIALFFLACVGCGAGGFGAGGFGAGGYGLGMMPAAPYAGGFGRCC